jgi:hypothetical protein
MSYQVEYPAELLLETSRRRMRDAAPTSALAERPHPSPAPRRYDIEDQLLDLEAQF